MEKAEYRALIEKLGDLTKQQREALLEALSARTSADEVVATIEAKFVAEPACGHCRAATFIAWGRASGLRRYKCKACDRTFNALTGTPLANLHLREKWLDYARALADGVSLRKAAQRCDIDLTTSFRWRHRFLKAPKSKKVSAVMGIVEADETYIRKSAKGSRNLGGRAPRRRGEAATKAPRAAEEHDVVLIVRDRHGATTDAILHDLKAQSFTAVLSPILAKDAVLVSDGCKGFREFPRSNGIKHVILVARRGVRARGVYHIQNVNAYTSRLKGWMARFRGVASSYLENYLGWRRMLDRTGNTFSAQHCLALALSPT